MECLVVGYSDSFKWSKNGRDGEGMRVNITRKPMPYERGVNGLVTDSIYLDSSMFSLIPDCRFDLNKKYDFVYSSDGRRSFLSEIVKVV